MSPRYRVAALKLLPAPRKRHGERAQIAGQASPNARSVVSMIGEALRHHPWMPEPSHPNAGHPIAKSEPY
jgi:hypothetical protein